MDGQIPVEDVSYNGKTFHVIQDAGTIGGTKSRGILELMKRHDEFQEFVYAGPAIGYAQYALAYCASQLGKKATVFLSCGPNTRDTDVTKKAKKYKPKIIKLTTLKEAEAAAAKYCEGDSSRYLCPFGMNSDEFRQILLEKLQDANMPTIPEGSEIWVPVGSGTLLRVLMEIYPNTHFHCIIVGKKMWEDQYEPDKWARMTRHTSTMPFSKRVPKDQVPPYKSVLNYDAKVWWFARELGKSGDYIFNVAG